MRLRHAGLALAVIAPLLLPACAEYQRDGGLEGQLQNNIINAPNRQWQVYRGAMWLMLFSAIAEAELKDANSVASYYYAARAVAADINNLAGHIYPQTHWYPWNIAIKPGDKDKKKTVWKAPNGDSIAHEDDEDPYNTLLDGKYRISGGTLYPCANFTATDATDAACRQSALNNKIPFNYVGNFNSDIPKLNNHLYRLAASSIRTDRLKALVNDFSSPGVASTVFKVNPAMVYDLISVTGELLEAERFFAAVWRSEADNSAAIRTRGQFPNAGVTNCDPKKSAVFGGISECAARATTEDALAATPGVPVKADDVPPGAYDPVFALVRKSCSALRGILAKAPDPPKKGDPTLYQDAMKCEAFILAPNVYRAEYRTTPP